MLRFVIAMVLGVLVLLMVAIVFSPDLIRRYLPSSYDPQDFADSCLKASGADIELGVGVKQTGDGFSSNLGIEEHIEGSQDAEIVEKIIDCLQTAYQGAEVTNDYHTTEPVQLGLVADQWSEGGTALSLQPTSSKRAKDILNNLSFGPASGRRPDLIQAWCSRNLSCVSCKPNVGADTLSEASTVIISLQPDAHVEKLHYGTAPLAGHRKEPWQLVEKTSAIGERGIGARVIYKCEKP